MAHNETNIKFKRGKEEKHGNPVGAVFYIICTAIAVMCRRGRAPARPANASSHEPCGSLNDCVYSTSVR